MNIGTAGSWTAACIGVIATAVVAIWPDEFWIAEVIFACTAVTLAATWGWWFRANYGGPRMGPFILIAAGTPLLLVGTAWWIAGNYRPSPRPAPVSAQSVPTAVGGKGGDAKVGGEGVAVGGPGGNVGAGGSGQGGAGGGGEVTGNGIAVGGMGGSVDGRNIWYPPALSGYEIMRWNQGKRPDPALKPYGRGGMSPGYASRFAIVEKLRAEYFWTRHQKPISVDENIGAVPLDYLNERLRATGEHWQARINQFEQYEFFLP